MFVLDQILGLNTSPKTVRRSDAIAMHATLPLDDEVLELFAIQKAREFVVRPHAVHRTRTPAIFLIEIGVIRSHHGEF